MRISDWSSDVCSSDLMLGITEVYQRVEPGHGLDHHIAAPAAIAAVRPAVFDILLAPEADGPWATGTRLEIYLGLVEKMHGRPLCISPAFGECFARAPYKAILIPAITVRPGEIGRAHV